MIHDCIVLGTGGVGSAALAHLAARGVSAIGLDRFPPAHDRGSSHGETRIIRMAYFEHPDYVPLLRRAYELWEGLEAHSGRQLYEQVGLFEAGPPEGTLVGGVLASAERHGLAIERLGASEAAERFPAFRLAPGAVGVFEERAGFLRVEECVRAHTEAAETLGAKRIEEAVTGWEKRDGIYLVHTEHGAHEAKRLIITAGPWAKDFVSDLGAVLQVRRKPVLWMKAPAEDLDADNGCPCFLFETPAGFFYGFPRIDGASLKLALHSGGEPVPDPLAVDRSLRPADVAPVEEFLRAHIPAAEPQILRHSVCMYTMSPDEHFIVDRHPCHEGVVFACGLSGHGFKFASVLGEALVQIALDGASKLPLQFLSLKRFA